MLDPITELRQENAGLYEAIADLLRVSTDMLEVAHAYNNGENCPACGDDYVDETHERGYEVYGCPNDDCNLTNAQKVIDDVYHSTLIEELKKRNLVVLT